MKNKTYKVLMFNGFFVNPHTLEDGIYEDKIPILYRSSLTIEEKIEGMGQLIKHGFTPMDFNFEEYKKNILQCELKEVELKFV